MKHTTSWHWPVVIKKNGQYLLAPPCPLPKNFDCQGLYSPTIFMKVSSLDLQVFSAFRGT